MIFRASKAQIIEYTTSVVKCFLAIFTKILVLFF